MLEILGLLAFGVGYALVGLPMVENEEGVNESDKVFDEDKLLPSLLEIPTETIETTTNQVIELLRNPTIEAVEIVGTVGGEYSDTLAGDSQGDTIHGAGGNDNILSEHGENMLFGGHGDDSLTGGDGNDIIFGGANEDSIISGDGDDRLYGGDGEDTIHGQAGDDTIFGGDDEHSDFLIGGDGDDFIFADEADRVLLGEGYDTVKTSSGSAIQVFDFDIDNDCLVIDRTQGIDIDELDFVEAEAGLMIQHNGDTIVTLAGLTAAAQLNITLE